MASPVKRKRHSAGPALGSISSPTSGPPSGATSRKRASSFSFITKLLPSNKPERGGTVRAQGFWEETTDAVVEAASPDLPDDGRRDSNHILSWNMAQDLPRRASSTQSSQRQRTTSAGTNSRFEPRNPNRQSWSPRKQARFPPYNPGSTVESHTASPPAASYPPPLLVGPLSVHAAQEEHSRTQQLFRSKKEARRLRQSLKESGDFLGVQGVNPETGEMDVLTPTTTSSSTAPLNFSPELGSLAQMARDAKLAYREAKRQHEHERQRALSRREEDKLEKMEKEKEAIRLEQRHVRWRKEAGQWSSVAEPNLSPIAQSQRSGTTCTSSPRAPVTGGVPADSTSIGETEIGFPQTRSAQESPRGRIGAELATWPPANCTFSFDGRGCPRVVRDHRPHSFASAVPVFRVVINAVSTTRSARSCAEREREAVTKGARQGAKSGTERSRRLQPQEDKAGQERNASGRSLARAFPRSFPHSGIKYERVFFRTSPPAGVRPGRRTLSRQEFGVAGGGTQHHHDPRSRPDVPRQFPDDGAGKATSEGGGYGQTNGGAGARRIPRKAVPERTPAAYREERQRESRDRATKDRTEAISQTADDPPEVRGPPERCGAGTGAGGEAHRGRRDAAAVALSHAATAVGQDGGNVTAGRAGEGVGRHADEGHRLGQSDARDARRVCVHTHHHHYWIRSQSAEPRLRRTGRAAGHERRSSDSHVDGTSTRVRPAGPQRQGEYRVFPAEDGAEALAERRPASRNTHDRYFVGSPTDSHQAADREIISQSVPSGAGGARHITHVHVYVPGRPRRRSEGGQRLLGGGDGGGSSPSRDGAGAAGGHDPRRPSPGRQPAFDASPPRSERRRRHRRSFQGRGG